MKVKIENVPTNIITGFLGVGKTTAILHLLEKKPANERWAVLVNEFGEIGVDGSIFAGQQHDKPAEQTVFFKEVPGGCMCCASGLPMQIALTLLLAEAKADRLLIEPTGLGHPMEVMQVLTSENYAGVLDVQKTITLVDARKVSDERYRNHHTFRQQLEIADVVVANKSDQYDDQDEVNLLAFLQELDLAKTVPCHTVSMGQLKLEWLEGAAQDESIADDGHHHDHSHAHQTEVSLANAAIQDEDIPDCGYVTIANEGEGFFSQGWIFHSSVSFDHTQLEALFLGAEVERLKGVLKTARGVFTFNKVDGVLSESSLDYVQQGRIEIIAATNQEFQVFEQALLACISE